MKHFILLPLLFFTLRLYAQEEIVKVGQHGPYFSIPTKNGQQIDSATFKNKVVLINFFATWCRPCMKELPILQNRVWEKYKDNNNFVLLVIGREHSEEEISKFKKDHNFNLPMYPDKNRAVYSLFATQYIPRNFIIDKEGKVVFSSIGYSENDFDDLVSTLKDLLDKK